MRRFVLIAVALAATSLAPAAAVPPAAGGALSSSNVDFVANIGNISAIGGRILREVPTLLGPRDLLYVTTGKGLQIFDVTLGIPVPTGALALPHFENEDVDTNGEILLIAADHFLGLPNILYVIDVSVPHAPLLTGVLPFPSEAHTVSCINDCSYAWLAGGSGVFVVDLTDPSAPKQVGQILKDEIGRTHDVQIDDAGIAWVTGSTVSGWVTGDPRTPSGSIYPTGATGKAPKMFARQNGLFNNNFILHNSMRPNGLTLSESTLGNDIPEAGEAVFVTEEDYISLNEDGSFQGGYLKKIGSGPLTIVFANRYTNANNFPIGSTSQKIGIGFSSSHYFDYKDDIMAVAWYEQGTRFFDVSDPRDLRPIGYFMPVAGNETWNVLFNGEWIYTIDVGRGIDVLKLTGTAASATVEFPEVAKPALSAPHPQWGACRLSLRAA